MVIKNRQELSLTNSNIDSISESLAEWMKSGKEKSKLILRARLTLEELLISTQKHFGEEHTVTVHYGKRLGKRFFKVVYGGESFNPYSAEEEYGEWANRLLTNYDAVPAWNYSHDKNEIVITFGTTSLKPEVLLILSLVMAIGMGLMKPLFHSASITKISEYVLQPLSGIFVSLLNTFAVILIFLSVLSGICGIGNTGDLTKFGKAIISRFFLVSSAAIGIGIILLYPFYRLPFGELGDNSQIKSIIDNIIQIFPSDPISPFKDRNMLQVIFMAAVIGIVILAGGNRFPRTRGLVFEFNDISIKIVSLVCRFLPIYIFSTLTLMFWKHGFDTVTKLWKPIVIYICLVNLYMVFKVVYTSIKFKANPLKIFSKVLPIFLIGITTASSMAAFSKVLDVDENKLGVTPEVTRFGVPIGNLLCVPTTGTAIVSIIYYLTDSYGMTINISWFIILWIMTVIFAMSIPPVSGGPLVCLGVIMTRFGLPAEGLALAGTLSIILDFFDAATRVVTSQMDLCLAADKLGKLDKKVFRS